MSAICQNIFPPKFPAIRYIYIYIAICCYICWRYVNVDATVVFPQNYLYCCSTGKVLLTEILYRQPFSLVREGNCWKRHLWTSNSSLLVVVWGKLSSSLNGLHPNPLKYDLGATLNSVSGPFVFCLASWLSDFTALPRRNDRSNAQASGVCELSALRFASYFQRRKA